MEGHREVGEWCWEWWCGAAGRELRGGVRVMAAVGGRSTQIWLPVDEGAGEESDSSGPEEDAGEAGEEGEEGVDIAGELHELTLQ